MGNPVAANRNYSFSGIAVTRQVTKSLLLGGKIYHQTADAIDTRATTGLGLGASWQFAPKWSLIGSSGPLLMHRAQNGGYALYLALEYHD